MDQPLWEYNNLNEALESLICYNKLFVTSLQKLGIMMSCTCLVK